ncbi:cation transporter [Thiohalocapsa marina]|uniref:Cation transporter n=1 Tax=Thiohalocapsa marina TaxID=424902 RepID=A0A5M8FTD0_9GAMM|nr:Na+/H+ antiporter subunit E [Thiohalocapsa marina]KAA6187050.1 cation transporter [Thiohalocapsa marina]
MTHRSPGLLAKRLFLRGALFAGVWVLLVGPDPVAWIVGGPAVIGATVASLWLIKGRPSARPGSPGSSLSLTGLLRFTPYFLWESVRGGLDVAGRVMVPRLRIRPGVHVYRMRLRGRPARVMFIDSVSLIPGTLSADLRGDQVSVHALDTRAPLDAELRRLEERVAGLFGEVLDHQAGVDSPPAAGGAR